MGVAIANILAMGAQVASRVGTTAGNGYHASKGEHGTRVMDVILQWVGAT